MFFRLSSRLRRHAALSGIVSFSEKRASHSYKACSASCRRLVAVRHSHAEHFHFRSGNIKRSYVFKYFLLLFLFRSVTPLVQLACVRFPPHTLRVPSDSPFHSIAVLICVGANHQSMLKQWVKVGRVAGYLHNFEVPPCKNKNYKGQNITFTL